MRATCPDCSVQDYSPERMFSNPLHTPPVGRHAGQATLCPPGSLQASGRSSPACANDKGGTSGKFPWVSQYGQG